MVTRNKHCSQETGCAAQSVCSVIHRGIHQNSINPCRENVPLLLASLLNEENQCLHANLKYRNIEMANLHTIHCACKSSQKISKQTASFSTQSYSLWHFLLKLKIRNCCSSFFVANQQCRSVSSGQGNGTCSMGLFLCQNRAPTMSSSSGFCIYLLQRDADRLNKEHKTQENRERSGPIWPSVCNLDTLQLRVLINPREGNR